MEKDGKIIILLLVSSLTFTLSPAAMGLKKTAESFLLTLDFSASSLFFSPGLLKTKINLVLNLKIQPAIHPRH